MDPMGIQAIQPLGKLFALKKNITSIGNGKDFKMNKPLIVRSVRFDEADLKEAKELKINISDAAREGLKKKIYEKKHQKGKLKGS